MTASPAHVAGCRRRWERWRRAVAGVSMSAMDISRALGVDQGSVANWIALGWLDAHTLPIHGYAITEAALRLFLAQRGALIRGLRPNRRWHVIVKAARADLEARYIDTAGIAAVFCVGRDMIRHRQRRYGFPRATLQLGGRNGGDWYDRTAVRAWLIANPRYLTTAAKREFGL